MEGSTSQDGHLFEADSFLSPDDVRFRKVSLWEPQRQNRKSKVWEKSLNTWINFQAHFDKCHGLSSDRNMGQRLYVPTDGGYRIGFSVRAQSVSFRAPPDYHR